MEVIDVKLNNRKTKNSSKKEDKPKKLVQFGYVENISTRIKNTQKDNKKTQSILKIKK